ncbi:MAG: N-glycosylase/DNA lyase [Candidatus ainarchaeum sp.]|nr:N-glycosylase/DNA lyase [Candidatus ainarchaeum sp.]MDD3975592.1 N-glycosylase/DNA lyase [Candidatus ainarchaeum sp.]
MNQKDLFKKVNDLKKSDIRKVIEKRKSEFLSFQKKPSKYLFLEMSFCNLTANYSAKRAIEITKKIKSGFISFSEKKLSSKLKELGYRYPNLRSSFIVYNRQFIKDLRKNIFSFKDDLERREYIVKNIKGLSYKEASHFLRNIGFFNYAIIDFHIIDVLIDYKFLKEKPKTLNKQRYLEIEEILSKMSKKLKLTQGELDLYLWYLETGEVLK